MKAMGFDAAEYGMGAGTTYDDPELEALNKQLMGQAAGIDNFNEKDMLAALDDELGIDPKKEWQDECASLEQQIAAELQQAAQAKSVDKQKALLHLKKKKELSK